jgi:hypothetical protein
VHFCKNLTFSLIFGYFFLFCFGVDARHIKQNKFASLLLKFIIFVPIEFT